MELLIRKMKRIRTPSRRNLDQCNNFQTVPNMRVNGTPLPKRGMVVDIKSGVMAPSMKDIGKMIKPMEEVDLSMLMEISMMDTGKTIKLMDMGSILTPTVLNMKDTGSMTSSMVKVKNTGQMVLNTKVIIHLVKRMDLVNSIGLINHHMLETLLIIIFTVMENTSGQIKENIKVIGSQTKCMEQVLSRGLMEESMKVTTTMTKNKDTVNLPGQMEECTMATG